MIPYYNKIKLSRNKTTAEGDSWMRMFLSNDTSHNPNALDGMNPPHTFYHKIGNRLLDWAYGSELLGTEIDTAKIIEYRNILLEADDQKELERAYTETAQILYKGGIRDPEALDPKRYEHFKEYVIKMLSEMFMLNDYDVSVIRDPELKYVELAIGVINSYMGVRKPYIAMIVPREDIVRNLSSFDKKTFYTLMYIYKNSKDIRTPPITFEDVVKTGNQQFIGIFLSNCVIIPTAHQLGALQGHFFEILAQGTPIRDQRLKELVERFMTAYPDEPTENMVYDFYEHSRDNICEILEHLDNKQEFVPQPQQESQPLVVPVESLELAHTVRKHLLALPKELRKYIHWSTNPCINRFCPDCYETFEPTTEKFILKCNHGICRKCFEDNCVPKCPYCKKL